MKTSKLLITSLLAAAAMGTVPAWADVTVTQDTTNGTSGSQELGAISFSGDYTYTWNINAWGTATVSGLSGTGRLSIERREGGGNAQVLKLSGTNTDFTGTIAVKHSDTYTTRNVFLALQGEDAAINATVDVGNYGGLLLSGASATASNVKIAGLTGNSTGVVYATTIDSTTGQIGNTNSALTQNGSVARTLIFTGSDTYSYAGTVGSTTNQSSLNLTKSGTGTQTLSGTTYLGNLEVSGGELVLSGTANIAGTTTVGAGGTLDLSGGTITLASAIQNSGTITVSNGTIFNLTDALKNEDGSYTLVSNSGSGSITNWTTDTLSATNFTLDGKLLSGRTQITLDAGGVTFSGGAYDLFWKGGDGTWDMATAANFGKDSVSGADTKFVAGDNVTFSSSATVAVSEGIRADVVSITGTVDAPTTLTLTNQANLTANSIHIGDNATLELGDFTSGGTVNHKLTGTGTVSLAKRSQGHGLSINIGTEFAGTVVFSGMLEFGGAVLGSSSAKLNLTDVHLWSGSGTTKTLGQAITFNGADNKFGSSGINGTLNLTGGVTFSEGARLTMTIGGTLNISGSMTGADISQSGGTLNISLSQDSTIKSLTQTSGTFEIVGASDMSLEFTGTSTIKSLTVKSAWNDSASAGYNRTISVENGASVSVEGDFLLRNEYNNTSKLNVEGDVSVGGNFWIARDGKGIVNINDGGTVVANTLTFGQRWADSAGTSKTSQVNVAEGGKLIAGSIVANTDRNSASDVDILKSSALNLNGGTLGTSADSMTIDVTSGSTALSVVLGTETTSTINTGKYDTSTKTFTDTGATISIANVISGDGALKKAGAGMLTLSNANTYKGGTVIEAGTVVAANANALGTTKGVEVQSGATLNLGASAVTVAGLSGAGSVGLADGTTSSTLTVDSASDSTFSGSISGDMSVVKTGAGTQEFSGVFTLLGESDNAKSVSVQEGMLKLHLDTGSTPFVGSISVSSGSSLGVVAASNSYFGVAATTDGGYTYDGSISFDVGGKLVVDLNSVVVVDGATEIALKILTSSAISFAGTDVASMTLTDATLGGFVEFIDTDGVFSEFEKSWVYAPDEWNNSTLFLTMTIPEPSAFGLLAGAGALALVAARRRRTKKA